MKTISIPRTLGSPVMEKLSLSATVATCVTLPASKEIRIQRKILTYFTHLVSIWNFALDALHLNYTPGQRITFNDKLLSQIMASRVTGRCLQQVIYMWQADANEFLNET